MSKKNKAEEYEQLKLKNQICFPLYACSKEVIRHYKPFLDELNLTYTQYITMLVMWEEEEMSVKELGSRLCLDSGTLTPLLKSLEGKGFIKRTRSAADERVLLLTLTEDGASLKEKAATVPSKIAACTNLSSEEAAMLYKLLYKLLGQLEDT